MRIISIIALVIITLPTCSDRSSGNGNTELSSEESSDINVENKLMQNICEERYFSANDSFLYDDLVLTTNEVECFFQAFVSGIGSESEDGKITADSLFKKLLVSKCGGKIIKHSLAREYANRVIKIYPKERRLKIADELYHHDTFSSCSDLWDLVYYAEGGDVF